jgi:hypothetical protein
VAGGLESRGHDFLGSDGGRRLGSRINRKRRPAKRAAHDQVNQDRNGKIRARSKEAGGSPGYGDSPPFGHFLHLRMTLLELCPRGNNKDVIIIILVHDNVYIPC